MNYNIGAYNQNTNYSGVLLGNYNSGKYNSAFAYNRVNLPYLASRSVDLYVEHGSEYLSFQTVRDVMGNAVNISGYGMECTIQRYNNTENIGSLMAFPNDTKNGKFVLSVSGSAAINLIHERYVYTVSVVTEDNTVRIQHGQILMTK